MDHQTGRWRRSSQLLKEKIFAEAKSQAAAMAEKSVSLRAAVDKAEKGLLGSRAVSVTPELKDGHSVAVVSLLKDGKYTSMSEPLE